MSEILKSATEREMYLTAILSPDIKIIREKGSKENFWIAVVNSEEELVIIDVKIKSITKVPYTGTVKKVLPINGRKDAS